MSDKASIIDMREAAAKVAAMFIINRNSIHPDIPFDDLSEKARNIAHTTCHRRSLDGTSI